MFGLHDHCEYSKYSHKEVIEKVLPHIRSDVNIIPVDSISLENGVNLSKFRFSIGAYFYHECAMYFDNLINEHQAKTVYCYCGDKLHTFVIPDADNVIIFSFYLGFS